SSSPTPTVKLTPFPRSPERQRATRRCTNVAVRRTPPMGQPCYERCGRLDLRNWNSRCAAPVYLSGGFCISPQNGALAGFGERFFWRRIGFTEIAIDRRFCDRG